MQLFSINFCAYFYLKHFTVNIVNILPLNNIIYYLHSFSMLKMIYVNTHGKQKYHSCVSDEIHTYTIQKEKHIYNFGQIFCRNVFFQKSHFLDVLFMKYLTVD